MRGDQRALAEWLLRRFRRGAAIPWVDLAGEALPDAFEVLHRGRPRLWSGPAVRSQTLPGGGTMAFVQVCPGTFTIGSTELVERRVREIVGELLGLSADDLKGNPAVDAETIGSDVRTRLREAIQSGIGATLDDDDWKAVADLAGAKRAVAARLYDVGERPAHPLLTQGFWLARTETTRAQLLSVPAERLARRLTGSEERNALEEALKEANSGQGNRPEANTSWPVAAAYCAEIDGGLPSEAQWEYATRGGSRAAWSWGDDNAAADRHAWYGDYGRGSQPVASPKLQPNPLGLYDMHGNLWEWVCDCWDEGIYAERADSLQLAATAEDPIGCRQRVLRGGSFAGVPWLLRSAFRDWFVPVGRRAADVGFRCVRSGAPALDNSSP